MVKKGSRRGLNTGNTIRDYRRNPALRQFQKYGCLVMGAHDQQQIQQNQKAQEVMQDVFSCLPPNLHGSGVELSLNKKRRWELPHNLVQTVDAESDSKDIEVRQHLL